MREIDVGDCGDEVLAGRQTLASAFDGVAQPDQRKHVRIDQPWHPERGIGEAERITSRTSTAAGTAASAATMPARA